MKFGSLSKLFAYLILLLIVFLTERAYNKKLFNYSLEIIPKLMRYTPTFLQYYFSVVSFICSKYILLPLIVFIYSFCSLKTSFISSNLLLASFHIVNILKMVYADPRPFMVTDSFIPKHCYGDFGNPSGETVYAFSFYQYMFLLFYREYIRGKQLFYRILFLIGIIILLFSIPISRMIDGIHSLNQIVYGCLIGLIIFFLFYLFIDSNDDSEDLRLFSNFKKGKWFPYFLIILCIGCIFNSCIEFSFYSLIKVPFENRLRQICPDLKNYSIFYNKCFGLSLSIAGNLGIIIGLIVTMETLDLREENITENQYHLFNNWNKTSLKCGIIRFIISISIAVLCALPTSMSKNRLNTLDYVILNYGVVSFVICFIFYGIMIKMFWKMGLTNEELSKNTKEIELEKDEREKLVCG